MSNPSPTRTISPSASWRSRQARPEHVFWRELGGIDVVVKPAKTVVLPPKGSVQTAEDNSFLATVAPGIAEGRGVAVVGDPTTPKSTW